MKEKLFIAIFILHNLTIYIHFMMGTGEISRYHLFSISNRGYNFNKTSSVAN